MTRVKICGITSSEDALAAASFGADALGFIFAPSPRQVSPNQVKAIIRDLPPFVVTVGVFVNTSVSDILEIQRFCGLNIIQLHGDEILLQEGESGDAHPCAANIVPQDAFSRVIKAIRVSSGVKIDSNCFPNATLLIDTYTPGLRGGSGKTFDWNIAKEIAKIRPIIMAGGLTPDNIFDAINMVRPYGVDVASGVEQSHGKKDLVKMKRFIEIVKSFCE